MPGHNTSYKRAALLDYDEKLESMLDAETVLHWDMRAKGHRLYHETTAQVAHTNFALWSSWLPLHFWHGQLFAGLRSRQMPWWKRAVYIGGSPLIPLVRTFRIVRDVWQRRSGRLLRRLIYCFPAMVLGLMLDACGQLIGYASGTGNALQRAGRYEFHRDRHITEEDRQAIFV